jgi:hypothetical protein
MERAEALDDFVVLSATVTSKPNPRVGAIEAPSGILASFIIRLMQDTIT